ncbi:Tautomerase/MIF [Fomitiporia mediterranea MF3/22]|uniref:Tautomerase/MIF n=1 Tax=Fomitiporia mediterranea (strain MF3/22) TaxID=694068 RepID=UPI0004407970|nr:Tautomerase/MIF [Fomitiporia mediterranea MF3/22]EJD06168.1 Tautomerase/MIF [Fomitiporia mediterranea MF3/22]
MPALQLTTNVKIDDVKAFSLEFSKIAAEALGKPESYISVCYTYNESLTFAGSFEPAFLLSIISLGNLNPQANAKYSKALTEFFEKKLGLKNNRGYITFVDPGREFLGYQGATF